MYTASGTVKPLLLRAAIVEELELGSSNSSTRAAASSNDLTLTDAVVTVVCAPDDGWRYHPKHVEQFTDVNILCNVASCWIFVGINGSKL